MVLKYHSLILLIEEMLYNQLVLKRVTLAFVFYRTQNSPGLRTTLIFVRIYDATMRVFVRLKINLCRHSIVLAPFFFKEKSNHYRKLDLFEIILFPSTDIWTFLEIKKVGGKSALESSPFIYTETNKFSNTSQIRIFITDIHVEINTN